MSRLLVQRKSSIKPVITIKEPLKKPGIQFRWSVTASEFAVGEKTPSPNFHLMNLDNNEQKTFIPCAPSSPVAARNSRTNRSPCSTNKLSPCPPSLPNITNVNKKKELSISTNQNNNRSMSPLSLTYSQLHRAQHPSQTKKISEAHSSIYSLLKNKRNDIPNTNKNISFSTESPLPSINHQQSTTNKYIRLRTPQLRRFHMSTKNMKEAKKLYFNAASKVFVPHCSIIRVSQVNESDAESHQV